MHQPPPDNLPACVSEYIYEVVKRMRYRRRVRRDVRQELTDHFLDALREFPDPAGREQQAQALITQFGSAKLLARLIRRGKKRCRPLWQKTLIRTAQAAALLIVLLIAYTISFITAEPTIRIDYIARANELVHPKLPESQNAWSHFLKAAELYVRPTDEQRRVLREINLLDSWNTLTPQQAGHLGTWLDTNDDAWHALVLASQRPHYWRTYDLSDDTEPLGLAVYDVHVASRFDLPDDGQLLACYRDMCKQGIRRAFRAVAQNDPDGALRNCLVVTRAGKLLCGKKPFGVQTIGALSIALSHRAVLRMSWHEQFSADQLRNMQTQLRALFRDGFPVLDCQWQEMATKDMIQRFFTAGGLGGGHVTIPAAEKLALRTEDDTFRYKIPVQWYAAAQALVQVRRKDAAVLTQKYFTALRQQSSDKPHELWSNPQLLSETFSLPTDDTRYSVVRKLLPRRNLQTLPRLFCLAKADHEVTLTVLALRIYHADKGAYPETLPQLVTAGYLHQLPDDPYSASHLVYRRTGDNFILYSLGADFNDDGGVEAARDIWARHGPGDRVFWPDHPCPQPRSLIATPASPGASR